MNVYYAETDHLGSLPGLMNSDGSYAERYSFDPWGQRRNPSNWSYDSIPVPALTDRGFTGHEHLDEFGLINMNGRLYDPLTARFLNADPIIQDPFDSQNLNLYSYCLNNPLKYTDPSGYYTHPWNAWREAVRNGYPGTYSEFSDIYDQMCSDAGGDSFTFSWDVNSYAIIGETYVGKDNVVHTPELVFTCRVLKIVYYDDPLGQGDNYFEDARVYTLDFGHFKNGAAMTIPGVGIFVGPGDANNIDLLRHEYGHKLQYKKWGVKTFWGEIVPASLKSANTANSDWSFNHMDTWTEWSANYLSYQYFNQPPDWNTRDFPILPTTVRPGVMPPFVVGPFDFKFNWLDN